MADCCTGNVLGETLDNIRIEGMMNVYCECGRIVWLDRLEMGLKLRIGKSLECITCRNKRISDDIDTLNRHFNGENIFEDY